MHVGFVKVKLNNPKEDGLVSKEESDDVGFIEDRLEPKLCNRKLKISPIIALKAPSLKIYTTNKVAYNFY